MNKHISRLLYGLILISIVGLGNYNALLSYDGNEIKTDSVLVINTDTETTVFEKNSLKKRSMASLTKIMTYIVTVENVRDVNSEKAVVKKEVLDLLDKDSSLSGLKIGEELSIFDLLHCLMIRSGNDSAFVLADYVGGGNIANFVELMNRKAEEIGCTETHFVNPDGIHDENHYSTAVDMYKITRYAMNLPNFMEICSKREYKLFDDGRPPLRTTNKMMNPNEKLYYYPFVRGIKTGWHSEAGRCLISCAAKDNMSYVCVAMGGPELDENGDNINENLAMIDTKNLYTWAFDNFTVKDVISKTDPFSQVKLKYAWRKDKVILNSEENVKMLLPKKLEFSNLETNLELPDFIKAPVEAGDFVGSAKLSYNGEILKEIKLVSSETVPMSWVAFFIDNTKNIIFSPIFLIVVLILLIIGIIYVRFLLITKKRKRRKRVKYYKKKWK